MLRSLSIKAVLLTLVAALVVPSALLLYPREAKAQGSATCASVVAGAVAGALGISAGTKSVAVMVGDWGTQASTIVGAGAGYGQFFKDCVLIPIAIRLGKAMLQNITQSLVTWINSGFHGNPSFVQNLNGLISDTTDEAISGFITQDLGGGFLCNSFSLQVKIAIAQSYLPYKKTSACSLKQISNNVSGFVSGDNLGGWDNWLQVTTIPQNNVYGATVLAQNELSSIITNKLGVQNRELDWGKGFRSWKVCKVAVNPETGMNDYADPASIPVDDKRCRETETRTPGTVVEGQLETTLGSGVRQLEVANDIDAIMGALTNQLMNQVVTGAKGLLGIGKSSNGSSSSVSYTQAIAGGTTDVELQKAIDTGVSTISTDSNINALFSTDQGTTTDAVASTTDQGTAAVNTTPDKSVAFKVIAPATATVTSGNRFEYEIDLASATSYSGLKIRSTLRGANSQSVPFLTPFVSFSILYGRTDTSNATSYIESLSDATAEWKNVSISPSAQFRLKFSGVRAYRGYTEGRYTLETVVTDADGNVLVTNVANFNVQ